MSSARTGSLSIDNLLEGAMLEVAVINVFSADNPEGRIDVAGALGSTATAMYVYDLSPGQSACPYHYEYEEEWLLVLDGTVALRTRDGERALERGDLVCFAAGPAGAHKITNRSAASARTLRFSHSRLPVVSVYPDSNKIGVWPGNEADDLVFRRETAVPWSYGEEGWDDSDAEVRS
jgi:uncharacterized cupin superfamily protein